MTSGADEGHPKKNLQDTTVETARCNNYSRPEGACRAPAGCRCSARSAPIPGFDQRLFVTLETVEQRTEGGAFRAAVLERSPRRVGQLPTLSDATKQVEVLFGTFHCTARGPDHAFTASVPGWSRAASGTFNYIRAPDPGIGCGVRCSRLPERGQYARPASLPIGRPARVTLGSECPGPCVRRPTFQRFASISNLARPRHPLRARGRTSTTRAAVRNR